jgi:hypothetical protein
MLTEIIRNDNYPTRIWSSYRMQNEAFEVVLVKYLGVLLC